MMVELLDVGLYLFLGASLIANGLLIWFTRKITSQFTNTIGQIDELGAEMDAFIESTEKLVESEVYLLGEEPVVKMVRSNAKTVLNRVNALLRNIPSSWQLPETEETENLNDGRS